jgi:hypothetical protein
MVFDQLKKYFTKDKLVRDAIVSCICLLAGIIVMVVFYLLAMIADRDSAVYFLLHNLGIFFLFTSVILIYCAIHRENTVSGEHTVRSLLISTARQAHIIAGILLASILALFAAAFAELVLSLFGYIPYAGPALMGLLSVPLFAVNVILVAAVVLIWISVPPMVVEGAPLKRLPMDFFTLTKKRGLAIFGYTMLSILALALALGTLLVIIRYAAGITRAVQWNISPAYPSIFKWIMRPSYITDIIGKIAPKTDPIEALRQYGTDIFDYARMLGMLLQVLYGAALAAVMSFFLSMFFNMMSYFHTLTKKDVLK